MSQPEQSPPDLLIIGGSHTLRLVMGAYEAGLPFRGGCAGPGRFFCAPFFSVRAGEFVVEAEAKHALRLADFGDILTHDGPILTDIGLNIGLIGKAMQTWRNLSPGGLDGLSQAAFRQSVLDSRAGALAFYAAMQEAGRDVYAVAGPLHPLIPEIDLARQARTLLLDEITVLGANIVDVDDVVLGSDGTLQDQYLWDGEGDFHHGNAAWGKVVIDRFAEMSGLTPPAVLPDPFQVARTERLAFIFARNYRPAAGTAA